MNAQVAAMNGQTPATTDDQIEFLDRPLLHFGPDDPWTYRDACEGVQIFGGIGSGKSSGSGRALAHALLRSGAGGLVLCAKVDEAEQWKRYAQETGREDSLIFFGPDHTPRLNFLDYEAHRPGAGAGQEENLARLLDVLLQIAGRNPTDKGEAYWEDARGQLLRHTIALVLSAGEPLTVDNIHNVIASIPPTPAAVGDVAWQQDSRCFELTVVAENANLTGAAQRRFEVAARYFMQDFAGLAEKTRSVVMGSVSATLDRFRTGVLHELFCTTTNVVPELAHEGAVIVIDLSVKEYGEVGRFANCLMKYVFQQAAERRQIEEDSRLIFQFCDEAQLFLTKNDQPFQTTARASRTSVVLLSQNISNYYAVLPPDTGRYEADSLLGNLGTTIFHNNADAVTNEWAATRIGKSFQTHYTANSGRGGQFDTPFFLRDYNRSRGVSGSRSLEYLVQPTEFLDLKKGGPKNDHEVEAIIVQAGRRWAATDAHYLRAVFNQND